MKKETVLSKLSRSSTPLFFIAFTIIIYLCIFNNILITRAILLLIILITTINMVRINFKSKIPEKGITGQIKNLLSERNIMQFFLLLGLISVSGFIISIQEHKNTFIAKLFDNIIYYLNQIHIENNPCYIKCKIIGISPIEIIFILTFIFLITKPIYSLYKNTREILEIWTEKTPSNYSAIQHFIFILIIASLLILTYT